MELTLYLTNNYLFTLQLSFESSIPENGVDQMNNIFVQNEHFLGEGTVFILSEQIKIRTESITLVPETKIKIIKIVTIM